MNGSIMKDPMLLDPILQSDPMLLDPQGLRVRVRVTKQYFYPLANSNRTTSL